MREERGEEGDSSALFPSPPILTPLFCLQLDITRKSGRHARVNQLTKVGGGMEGEYKVMEEHFYSRGREMLGVSEDGQKNSLHSLEKGQSRKDWSGGRIIGKTSAIYHPLGSYWKEIL